MTCSSKKKEFENIEAAEVALIDTRIRYVGNTSINVYQCESCGLWHLTSKGEINPRLEEMIESGALEEEIRKFEWRERYGSLD